MSRTARLWKGFGSVTLGGLMLSGVVARAEGPAPLSAQLSNLGRQAAAQGRTAEARTFFTQALRLDPADASARAGLDKLPKARLAAFQAPAAAPGDQPNTPPQATLERQRELENVRRQEFTTDVRQRLQRARDLTNGGRPEEALSALRVLLAAVQEADQVAEADKTRLANEVRVAILSTERTEERLNLERAEKYRIASAESARIDALDRLIRDQETTSTLMNEFDSLMLQGQYRILSNAGRGNINDILQPFVDARARAVAARAIDPLDLAPHAGITLAESIGFLSQSLAYEELKEYRFMFTLADVDRASVPFPDTNTIEYPLARDWQALSERRIKKYSNADYIFNRDERTQAILNKLEERVSMNFPNETPLEDVLKYIKSSTQDEAAGLPQGIPIYLDPVGLSEAEKTPTSTVTLDLEGVPLRVSLRLILKQLDLTYTVKDGHMQITYAKSEDQQLEIRVYQVADLAIIPLSLMGGGGGGMGGGMGGGGMGGGMGGGGMGGMGGGMGGGGMGGGMGGMGGMMSVAPQAPGAESSFQQKKSN